MITKKNGLFFSLVKVVKAVLRRLRKGINAADRFFIAVMPKNTSNLNWMFRLERVETYMKRILSQTGDLPTAGSSRLIHRPAGT